MYEMWFIDTHTLVVGRFYDWAAPEHEVQERVDAWNLAREEGRVGNEHAHYLFFARPEEG